MEREGWRRKRRSALPGVGSGMAPTSGVDCADETHFSRYCDLPGFRLGADMLEYTVLYPEET